MKKIISFILIVSLCISLWSPVCCKVNAAEAGTTPSNYTIIFEDSEGEEIAAQASKVSGEELQLYPCLKDNEGKVVEEAVFSYKSSNETVAVVSEDGLVSIKEVSENSTVNITVTWTNPADSKQVVEKVFTIEVQTVEVTDVTLNLSEKTLIVNQTFTLKPVVEPENASQKVTYESDNKKVASVDENGLIKAVAEGSASITVKSKVNPEKKAVINIKVIDVPVDLELEAQSHSMKAGDTYQLQGNLIYASGKKVPFSEVKDSEGKTVITYTIDKPYVADVTEEGLITAKEQTFYPVVAAITVNYSAEYNIDGESVKKDLTKVFNLTVTQIPVEEIRLENPEKFITLKLFETYTLKPVVLPANATEKGIVYSSSKASVASVDENGIITAKDIGETVITIAAKDNAEIKQEFLVKVYQTEFVITDFGANGGDTKVDTKVIKEVLQYAKKVEEQIRVIVPKGTYYIDGILTIYSDTSLELADGAVIKRKDSAGGNAMLRSSIDSSIRGYEQCKNIRISGGVWDGNANGTKDSDCIYIGHASNVRIENTVVKNNSGAHLIELAGVQDAVIENVELYGYTICKEKGYSGEQALKEAIQLDYCSSSSTPAMKPHDLTPCRNIVIKGCNIRDYMCGIGAHGSLSNVFLENIQIINNTFSDITNGCIDLRNFNNVTISGNTASGYQTFLYASGSTGTVTHNTMKNKSFNRMKESGLLSANGMTLSNGSSFTVTDNNIQNSISNGICVWNKSTANISKNTIKGSSLFGIRTSDSTISLKKNKFSKNKQGMYDTYSNAKIKSSDDIRAYYVKLKKSYKYKGKAVKPSIKIKGLKLNKNFKVSYKNNKRVGTATVTIKGKGSIKGTLKLKYKIVR